MAAGYLRAAGVYARVKLHPGTSLVLDRVRLSGDIGRAHLD